jgi:hypothetical protein
LVNGSNQITSGGLLFTAFETKEVFDWLLKIIADILVGTLRTIFTDEESALVTSADRRTGIRPEILHRLCTFHKCRDFQKKVLCSFRDPAIQAEPFSLFQTIIYSKRRSSVDQALRQLKALLPTLVEYIEVEIEALLPKLAEAFHRVAFTLGSRTIAVSESCNRILKSRPLLPTFVGIRNAHTRNHTMKAAAQARISNRSKRYIFLRDSSILNCPQPF